MSCTRVILVNTQKAPSREELSTSEREIGDNIFSPFELEYGGYEIVEGSGKKSARWMVPDEKWDAVLDFVESFKVEGYELMLFAQVETNKKTFSRRFA